MLFPHAASARDVKLAWDPNTQPQLAGYLIYYGKASRQYTNAIDAGNVTVFTVPNLPTGTYYFSLKAYGSAGNESPFSPEVITVLPADPVTTPPKISEITISDVTGTSATISWATDKLSDSSVEYWTSASPSTAKAALCTLETKHSLTLNRLREGTRYDIRVSSKDPLGQQTTASGFSFTTIQNANFAFAWPRFSSSMNAVGTDAIGGIALINLGSDPATITMTATDENGNPASGPGVSNPVIRELNPQSQIAILDRQIFGNGLATQNSNGWTKIEAGPAKTTGFFQIFDSKLSFMDGANLKGDRLTDFAFTEIQPDGYNAIHLINNNPQDATVIIDLVNGDGTVRSSRSRMITGNGALVADLFADLFKGTEPVVTEYVRVQSNMPLHSFQVMRRQGGDIAMLEGQDITTSGTILYSPQYAIGGNYRTGLSVTNLDSVAGEVAFRLIGSDGIQIGPTKTAALPPSGKLHIDDPGFFRPNDPGSMTAGYLLIASNGIRLTGSTVFEDINRRSFSSALALISNPQTLSVFSHIASNDTYFTGIAVLNPNVVATIVAIRVYAADGTLLDEKSQWIGAGRREALLLTQWFPSLQGKNLSSGYFCLASDLPIVSFALFGTNDLSAISAIPPQAVEE